MAYRDRVVSPGSTSIRSSSTTTAVTLKSASRSTVGQPAQHVQVGAQLEVVDRVEQPVQVGALVCEGRLGELDVPLLDGRPQDHLPADADGRRLGPGGQRRDVDLEVAGRLDQAGQPPAVVELLAAERLDVVPRRPGVAAVDPHLALVAGAVAAAGGVDGDAVPRRGVEDGDARRHPDRRAAVGRRLLVLDGEGQLDPAGAVVRLGLGARTAPSGPRGARRRGRSRESARRSCGPGVAHARRRPPSRGARRSRPCPTRRGRGTGRRP